MVCLEFEPKIMDDSHVRQTNFKILNFVYFCITHRKTLKFCLINEGMLKSKIVRTLHDC